MKNVTIGRLSGFTLIELLVVVLIIGILAAIAVPLYQKAVTKSRFAEAMSNLKTIAAADKVCRLAGAGGSCFYSNLCNMDELDISLGDSQNFVYNSSCIASSFGNLTAAASASYKREDVCMCLVDSGEFVISQGDDEQGCVPQGPTMDYAKLLQLREVGYEECNCC